MSADFSNYLHNYKALPTQQNTQVDRQVPFFTNDPLTSKS